MAALNRTYKFIRLNCGGIITVYRHVYQIREETTICTWKIPRKW